MHLFTIFSLLILIVYYPKKLIVPPSHWWISSKAPAMSLGWSAFFHRRKPYQKMEKEEKEKGISFFKLLNCIKLTTRSRTHSNFFPDWYYFFQYQLLNCKWISTRRISDTGLFPMHIRPVNPAHSKEPSTKCKLNGLLWLQWNSKKFLVEIYQV